MKKQKREKRKETWGYSQTTVVLSLWRQCVLAPCRHVAARGRLSTCSPAWISGARRRLCSPLSSLSLSQRNPNPSSRKPSNRRCLAVESPLPPPARDQAEQSGSSSSPCRSSPCEESLREARNHRRRPFPLRSGRCHPSTIMSPSGHPGTCRPLQRNSGEDLVLRDIPLPLPTL